MKGQESKAIGNTIPGDPWTLPQGSAEAWAGAGTKEGFRVFGVTKDILISQKEKGLGSSISGHEPAFNCRGAGGQISM